MTFTAIGATPRPETPRKLPGLFDSLAEPIGKGLGDSLNKGISDSLRTSALQRALGMVDRKSSPIDQYISLLNSGESPDVLSQLGSEYLPLVEKERKLELERGQKEAFQGGISSALGIDNAPPATGIPRQQQIPTAGDQPQGQQQTQPVGNAELRKQKLARDLQNATPEGAKIILQAYNSEQDRGVNANKEFREETNEGYKSYQFKKNALRKMEALNKGGDLSSPAFVAAVEAAGLPAGWILNPSDEEYQKLAQTLMNDIQSVYGSRLNVFAEQSFAKTIPTLINSKEGRERIIRDAKNVNESRKIMYDTYMQLSEGGTYLPVNLREQVLQKANDKIEQNALELEESMAAYKPMRMTKNGKPYDIPAQYVFQALQQGYGLE
jgi:hypothetical protein